MPAGAIAAAVAAAIALSGCARNPTNRPSPRARDAPTVDCRHSHEDADAVTECELGDILDVTLSQADAARLAPAPGTAPQPLRMFLDSRMIAETAGEWDTETPAAPAGRRILRFELQRTAANRAQWSALLGARGVAPHEVPLQIGTETGPTLIHVGRVRFSVAADGAGILAVGTLLAVCFVIITLRHRSLLRDGAEPTEGGERCYSLGRVQMAWWTLNVLLAHVAIWGLSGAFDTLTATVLGLMGISAGTTLGSGFIDASRATLSADELQNLQFRKASLDSTISFLNADLANNAAAAVAEKVDPVAREASLNRRISELSAARADVVKRIACAPTAYVSASKSLGDDLLTGSDGPELHRLQMLLWTAVLTLYFWGFVWRSLQMPDFDATWLALMGISSGVYLGFKLPART